MSEQFFYIGLTFTPRLRNAGMPTPLSREVIVEVPRNLVQSRRSESAQDKAIAIELARRTAVGTFAAVTERAMGLYDEGSPIWCKERPVVMNERPCDHEENGTRAWRIA
jgi:hypothetical protein